MLKLNGKIYDSYFGLPQIISLLAFNKELSTLSVSSLKEKLLNKLTYENE